LTNSNKSGYGETMITFINILLASLPVLISLILLILFKFSSMRTATIAYCLASALSLLPFRFHTSFYGIVHATIEGVLISIIVIYVLIFGLLLYNVLYIGGAISAISAVLMRFTHQPVEQALLISAALGPFLESTSGFGLGIVIAAPLYLALGFDTKKAALLSLLTQSAVPWGALAVGTVINAELANVSLLSLGVWSSVISVPLFLLYIVAVVYIAGGRKEIRTNIGSVSVIWILLSVSTWFTNAFISTQLAGVLAGLVTTAGLLLYWKLRIRLHLRNSIHESAATHLPDKAGITFGRAILPYGILVMYLLTSSLIPWLSSILKSIAVWRLPSYGYQLELLYNPGFALFIASLFAIWVFRLNGVKIRSCVRLTVKQVYPAAISTSGFVAMSTVMEQSGMINLISIHLAALLGASFILISPVIGGLGGFITGSNSAANAMFSPFQSAMAHKLHTSALLFATSQNVSASSMTMASPSRIALATAITNQSGKEGDMTRRVLPLGLIALFIIILCSAGLTEHLH
jgi:lactate permease